MIFDDFISTGSEKLDAVFKFSIEIDKMTGIFRRTMLLDNSRRENDAEHSWHIALMAIVFKDYCTIPIDLDKVIRMLLIHDLVEIYAGDTFAFDEKANSSKAKREKDAAEKLFSQLPDKIGEEIKNLWIEFELMQTNEAKYAACMDRLQPFLHNTLTNGKTWDEGKISRSAVEKRISIVNTVMPDLSTWIKNNINSAVEKGWIEE